MDEMLKDQEVRCPLCGGLTECREEKTQNHYWVCYQCKISVEILQAIRDRRR